MGLFTSRPASETPRKQNGGSYRGKGVLGSGREKAIHRQWLLAAPCPLYNLPLQRSNPLPTVSKSRTRVSSVLSSQNSVRIKVWFFNFFCVE